MTASPPLVAWSDQASPAGVEVPGTSWRPPPARTVIFFGLASSALGTTTSSTPFSNEASMASALTWAGRVIERRKLP